MTDSEYRALLNASRGPFRLLLFSLWNTGARPSELRRLRWSEVQGDRFVLLHHKTVRKTRRPRVIHLNKAMRRLVSFLRRRSSSEHVFLNRRGKRWTCNALRLNVSRRKKKLGLPDDVCLYLARHAFGTNAILRGVDVKTTAELMGHSSLEITSQVYCHIADQQPHLQAAVERITGALPTS